MLDGFLVKPVTSSMLYDAVADATHTATEGAPRSVAVVPGARLLNGMRLLVVEDNLTKGASGQAVQCMNLMFGLKETAGLLQVPVLP